MPDPLATEALSRILNVDWNEAEVLVAAAEGRKQGRLEILRRIVALPEPRDRETNMCLWCDTGYEHKPECLYWLATQLVR